MTSWWTAVTASLKPPSGTRLYCSDSGSKWCVTMSITLSLSSWLFDGGHKTQSELSDVSPISLNQHFSWEILVFEMVCLSLPLSLPRSSPTKISYLTNIGWQRVESKNPKCTVCTEIQFIFMEYMDAELTRRLSTYDAFYLVFQKLCVFTYT